MNDKKQPLAIALRYEQGTRDIAPKVVAKGRGEVAKKSSPRPWKMGYR